VTGRRGRVAKIEARHTGKLTPQQGVTDAVRERLRSMIEALPGWPFPLPSPDEAAGRLRAFRAELLARVSHDRR
jgi:hypothetical protein